MNHALMLVGWDVTGVKVTGNVQEATATYNSLLDACPKCGSVGRLYRHGVKTIEYRDAPAFGKQFVIICKVQRFRCRDCKETSMQPLPDMDTRRRMTKRCVDYIEHQGAVRTYADIARTIGIDEKTVRNICNEAFERAMAERTITAPIIMGIDELTLLGRKRAIFVDHSNKRLLDLIDNMNRGKVERWLMRLPNRHVVHIVTIDMWGPYREAVAATLPKAKVIVDKWHVVSKAGIALDKARNRSRRNAGIRRNPHKGRRLLHTRITNLSPMRRMALDGMLANNPLIADAWRAKEGFYAIWDTKDRAEAERLFDAWKVSIPQSVELEFLPVASMVENWRGEIFAYWDYPITNAYTEAMNGLIKIANRAGRGYAFETIRAKALLSEPYTGELCKCRQCNGHFPKSNLMPMGYATMSDHPKFLRTLTKESNPDPLVCRDCHFIFHTKVRPKALEIINSIPR
jgi:transposase